jgi:hypothetical protein
VVVVLATIDVPVFHEHRDAMSLLENATEVVCLRWIV